MVKRKQRLRALGYAGGPVIASGPRATFPSNSYLFHDTFTTPDQVIAATNPSAGDQLVIANASLGNLIPDGDFSVECWVYIPSGLTPSPDLILAVYLTTGNQRCWSLDINITTNDLRFYVSGDGSSASVANKAGTYNDGAWHHLLGTYNSTTGAMNLYVDDDGSPATQTHSGGGALFDTSARLTLFGGDGDTFPCDADVRIALCRFWSEELDADDAETLYNSGIPLRYADLPSALTTNLDWDTDCNPLDLTSNVGPDLAVDSGDTILWNYGPPGQIASSPSATNHTLEIANASLGDLVPDGDFTIEAWMYVPSAESGASNPYLTCYNSSANQRCWLMDENDGAIRWICSTSGTAADEILSKSIDIRDDDWHHIICTYNVTTGAMSIYVDDDGSPATATLSGGGALHNTTADLNVFGYDGTGGPHTSTRITLARAWSRELGSDDVTTLYNSGTPLRNASLPADLETNLIWDTNASVVNLASFVGPDLAVSSGDTINAADAPETVVAPSSPRTADVGSWDLTQTDGEMAVSGGQLAINPQASASWGDQGAIASDGQTRALGLRLSAKINVTTWEEFGIGWHTAQADPDNYEHALQLNGTDGQIDDENGNAVVTGLSTSTDYYLAIVLRAAGAFYYQGTDLADMSLVYVQDAGSTGTLKNLFDNLDAALTIDDVEVKQLDTSLFRPIASDSFDRSDSDSLGSTDGLGHPDGNGQQSALAWVEDIADVDISGNAIATPGSSIVAASIDASEADVVVQGDLVYASSGAHGILVRGSDSDNYWMAALEFPSNFTIFEKIAGVYTSRASTSHTHGAGTYVVKVIADGDTITAFVDDGSRITYASASFNNTATKHGVNLRNSGCKLDNFAVYARDGYALT